jgi:hypothetical protein
VKEVLDNGADGVTIPHVQNIDEARQAISFFVDAKANVWSPANPAGTKLAMLMLEDPEAVKQAASIADLKGISILACGIGSLTQALGGDRAGAEAATQQILAETKRVKIADMLTANPSDVETAREGRISRPADARANRRRSDSTRSRRRWAVVPVENSSDKRRNRRERRERREIKCSLTIHHSERNAWMTSTRAALAAGNNEATNAATSRMTADATSGSAPGSVTFSTKLATTRASA